MTGGTAKPYERGLLQPGHIDSRLGGVSGQARTCERALTVLTKSLCLGTRNAALVAYKGRVVMRTIYKISVVLSTILIGAGTTVGAAELTCSEGGNVSATTYVSRGDGSFAQGNLDAAIAAYEVAIRLDPDQANPYERRGFALQQKGDFDGALASFDEAVRLRFVENLNWLTGQQPDQPESTKTGGRVSLTSL